MKAACVTMILAAAWLIGPGWAAAGVPLGTAFTFQGQLNDGGRPAQGDYDLLFALYDAPNGGGQVGGDVPVNDWPVSNGLFTVQLDFGAGAFESDARWLQVAVRPGASNDPYTILLPRQPVTAAPVALYALDSPGGGGYWTLSGDDLYNNNTGKVGIRTGSPLFNLHVYDLLPASPANQPPTTFGVQWRQSVIPIAPNEWFYFAVGGTEPTVGSGTRLIRESGTELHFQTQDEIDSGLPSTQLMIDANGNVGIGTMIPAARLDVDGVARVSVLEIEGADVAEKFPVHEKAAPGTVMAIDPDHPGALCVARGAYNRRVAGVISGANRLPAGAILGHLPGNEHASPVALSGRVWVRCDATDHAVEPGDLLTTSSVPGHAMKVTDHDRANGAILGKAMTGLEAGEKGLVLVLVALQ